MRVASTSFEMLVVDILDAGSYVDVGGQAWSCDGLRGSADAGGGTSIDWPPGAETVQTSLRPRGENTSQSLYILHNSLLQVNTGLSRSSYASLILNQ